MAIAIEHNGETRTLEGWARHLNVSPDTLHMRKNRGWTDQEILQTPVKGSRGRGSYALAKETGLHERTIRYRMDHGYPESRITAPVVKPPSKSDAEYELNDTPFEKLPPTIAKTIKPYVERAGPGRKTKKYGEFMRKHFRSDFDAWFTNEWLPKKLNEG